MGLDVHQSTISHLLKNKDTIGKNLLAKRQKTFQHLDLEDTENLAKLFHISENDFKFSHSWLYKFKKRHGLKQIVKHEEDASVDDAIIEEALPRLREILKEYDLKDIYNMNETGLFYWY
ncbi:1749_t:CDS:2 [Cetraspora pellucida]|uniref:1749_t:CDS:1 n=1 Tax=Cetraspora pellucida TaxID=1433469 RepID=A0A9N9I9Q7_9GLOM|nr:1749_t:CDS:2 [Cetraspora pellucida]